MSIDLDYLNQAPLEELYYLQTIGYEFTVENGRITGISTVPYRKQATE